MVVVGHSLLLLRPFWGAPLWKFRCIWASSVKASRRHAATSLPPVGGAVDLWVRLRLLHHSPGRRGDEELFVNAIPQAVGDAT